MRASRNQLVVLAVLAVIALFMLPRFFSGGSSGTPAVNQAATANVAKTNSNPARTGRQAPKRPKLLPPSLDPALRHDLLAMGEDYAYDGKGRNPFETHKVEIPEPHDPGIKTPPPGPVVYTPPPPPPIPLKFYGFATQTGQAKRVFLSSGDDVFVGTEGQVINKRYKIVKIKPSSVLIEDILNNNTQPIPLTPASS